MIFTETALPGAFIVDLEPIADHRGFFARAWAREEFEAHGLSTRVVHCNLSYNERRGTLRGMHYQIAPHEEVKLIRCTRGAIFDAIVDLRLESPTYAEWIGVELTADNRRMLYVPEGFAHGYLALADDTEVFYQVSAAYAPGSERGIRWDDPALGIGWPDAGGVIVSEKDEGWPEFRRATAVGGTGS